MQIRVLSIFEINEKGVIDGVGKILDDKNVSTVRVKKLIEEAVRRDVEELLRTNLEHGVDKDKIFVTTNIPAFMGKRDYHVYRIFKLGPKEFRCKVIAKVQGKSKEWYERSLDASVEGVIREALNINDMAITRNDIDFEIYKGTFDG